MRLRSTPVLLIIIVAAPTLAIAQCKSWTDVMTQSFLANKDTPDALRALALTSAEQYRINIAANEARGVQQEIARAVTSSPALPNLRSRLRQFYQIGADLYGVRFDPEKLYLLPDMDLNAFATGQHVFFYEGMLLYLLDPVQFLVRSGQVPGNITRESYSRLTATFNWRNDWDSVYFVLAHEAGHNLMAHGDESRVEGVKRRIQQLASNAQAYRKAVAEGRSSTGVKHYLGRSLLSFISGPERSRREVAQEEEADRVGVEILRRAGLRPESGMVWVERMAVLKGPSASGWASVMNKLFCSTHPDSLQRMSNLRRNVSCLQFSGRLCEKSVAYSVSESLSVIRSEFEQIDQYLNETTAIAEGRLKPAGNAHQIVEIKPNPKECKLLVDGSPIEPGKVSLPAGRHTLTAARDGYRMAKVTFAVFPDVPKATIKFKLKRCDKGKPCDSELPEEAEVETEAGSESTTAATETKASLSNEQEERPYSKRKN